MQICLEANDGLWYLDSGFSRHMMGQESQFKSLKLKEGEKIAFGEDEKEKSFELATLVTPPQIALRTSF